MSRNLELVQMPAPLNAGVRADLAHRGLGGDGARRKRRQRQRHHQAKTAQRRCQLRSLLHEYAPLLPPGLHFSAKWSIMISYTGEYSPKYLLYCITTDPFRKGFCHKKGAGHRRLRRPRAGKAGRGAPCCGKSSPACAAVASKCWVLCPAPSEPLYFAEKSAILKLSEGFL